MKEIRVYEATAIGTTAEFVVKWAADGVIVDRFDGRSDRVEGVVVTAALAEGRAQEPMRVLCEVHHLAGEAPAGA